jgi:multidrug transporter EmrE-like cation transporter
MNMAYLYLLAAIILDVAATSALKKSIKFNKFSRLIPKLIFQDNWISK